VSDEDDSFLRAVAASPSIAPPPLEEKWDQATQEQQAPDLVDVSALALVRSGLRFIERDVELAHATWHVQRAIPFIRAGGIAALFSASTGMLAIPIISAQSKLVSTVLVLMLLPLAGTVVASTYRAGWRRWILPTTSLATALYGTWSVAMMLSRSGGAFLR
jgi:hypothetical protein